MERCWVTATLGSSSPTRVKARSARGCRLPRRWLKIITGYCCTNMGPAIGPIWLQPRPLLWLGKVLTRLF